MIEKNTLLIVEDDAGLQSQLKWAFGEYDLHFASDRLEAITCLRRFEPKVITLDLGLPPDPTNASEGLATLEEIKNISPNTKVIVVTGNDERENAIKAVSMGAYDYYQKPIDVDLLKIIIERAINLDNIEKENAKLQMASVEFQDGIIGASPQIQKIREMINKIAPTEATVLLLGESGTGKEVVARALHNNSARSSETFVAINCAAIPENLLESELFGYEKGAFTGASKQTKGKIEYADGGTLFLDEVGDLPFALQAKLLRFLQERTIERVGGREEISVDVRVICATHQDLSKYIAESKFREDLYYRVSEITINIPPLRDREGDAVLLAHSFLRQFTSDKSQGVSGFTDDAMKGIESYSWPGNVRELENKIKRAIILSDGVLANSDDLELGQYAEEAWEKKNLNLKQVREKAEKTAITQALSITNKNITDAAKLLGVSRPTFYDLIKKLGITLE